MSAGRRPERLDFAVYSIPGWGFAAAAACARGLRHLILPEPDPASALETLLARHPGEKLVSNPRQRWLAELTEPLAAYFRGRRVSFDVPLDYSDATPFRRAVWEQARRIGYGQTQTYGWIARRLGLGAFRAVGQAMGANRLALAVPCHRVVAADGLGGFGGRPELKRRLLELEAVKSEGAPGERQRHFKRSCSIPGTLLGLHRVRT